jgi:hypothetical protein
MFLEREISYPKLVGASERNEDAMETSMIDTGDVGLASNNMAEVTQRILAIVTNAQAPRHF